MPLTQRTLFVLYKYVGHEDPNELIKILKFFIEDGTMSHPATRLQ